MIRTPRLGRRRMAVAAVVSSAAALGVLGGLTPTASAAPDVALDPTVCLGADTHFFVNNVDGRTEAYAYYADPGAGVHAPATSALRWTWHRANKHVTVTATEGLRALGGFKQVANADGGVDETNIAWPGTIKLKAPAPGSGYWLCGDDLSR